MHTGQYEIEVLSVTRSKRKEISTQKNAEVQEQLNELMPKFSRFLGRKLPRFRFDKNLAEEDVAISLPDILVSSPDLSINEVVSLVLVRVLYEQLKSYFDEVFSVKNRRLPKRDLGMKPRFVIETWNAVAQFMVASKKKKTQESWVRSWKTNKSLKETEYASFFRVYESRFNAAWLNQNIMVR